MSSAPQPPFQEDAPTPTADVDVSAHATDVMESNDLPLHEPDLPADANANDGHRVASAVYDIPRTHTRETLEGLVMALIVALILRGFFVEAFIIPTGSMANTLMGQHKEVACQQCGFTFPVNASERSDQFLDLASAHTSQARERVVTAICGNCRYAQDVYEAPVYAGDRVLVAKFGAEPRDWTLDPSAGPKRWDVTVFRYPENPETNYIKRLVGLPSEEIRIHLGDIYVRPLHGAYRDDWDGYSLARKPWRQQDSMQTVVYDDRYRPQAYADHPTWKRWRNDRNEQSLHHPGFDNVLIQNPSAWQERPSGRFQVQLPPRDRTSSQQPIWHSLSYQHVLPTNHQWSDLTGASKQTPTAPVPTLITDDLAYNWGVSREQHSTQASSSYGHWCGDLDLACTLTIRSAQGTIRWTLIRAGIAYSCEWDLLTGDLRLLRDGEPLGPPVNHPVITQQPLWVRLANIDGRLSVRIAGQAPFGAGLVYRDQPEATVLPTEMDLTPARLVTEGSDLEVKDLVLMRDVYYTRRASDRSDCERIYETSYDDWAEANPTTHPLSIPQRWSPIPRSDEVTRFPIQAGHYFMLGDNSPRSSDSREWSSRDYYGFWDAKLQRDIAGWAKDRTRQSWEVPASHIIGRALLVYWPHAQPFWPRLRLTIRGSEVMIPIRPSWERMRRIH